MKKILSLLLTVMAVVCWSSVSSAATSVDALLEKLVEKGTFTKEEARKLKGDIAADEKLIQEDAFQRNLPSWVQSMKLKGDVRLRYQYEETQTSTVSRNRGRTRYRLGIDIAPIKTVTVSAGLASGGTDPRSTNVTWENTFERPDIRLDYSSIEYAAAPWAKVIGGKFVFSNYFWQTTDMMFDTDINPYGMSANFQKDLSIDMGIKGFVNGGVWILDESSATDTTDPFMTYVQGGVSYKKDQIDGKLAATYFNFHGVKGYDLDNENNTNTQVANAADANLQYDYDSVAVSAEVGVKELFGGLPFGIDERIAIFADMINNPEPSELNMGWASGFVFGNAKVDGMGQWQVKYQYVDLGKDAFPDVFPDSDRLGGRTDIYSHEAMLTVGLLKNVSFGLDYYASNRNKGTDNQETLIQGDLVVKF
ncbi:MAG: putative porin [Candidatus Omnitrophica bacterium]|nr:putative porin [Candidatus Omnitrophota bacterium]